MKLEFLGYKYSHLSTEANTMYIVNFNQHICSEKMNSTNQYSYYRHDIAWHIEDEELYYIGTWILHP